MQETRQSILEILRVHGQATVDEIVIDLQKRRGTITAVTVRHHLSRLQEDGLIRTPQILHRNTPGRPQHVYELTEQATNYFPNNYQHLLNNLLVQMNQELPSKAINVIFEGVADSMAQEAGIAHLPPRQRIELAVEFLNDHGYSARWEMTEGGLILHTLNCPYHYLDGESQALCEMDMRLVASLLGVVPRRLSHVALGDTTCSYLVPLKTV